MRPNAIAIDGPAGSGKSTIGRALAAKLGYALLDTGPLYRLVAHEVLHHGTDPGDEEAVLRQAEHVLGRVTISSSGRDTQVEVGGCPISSLDLHTREISSVVAFISRIPRIRRLVLRIQRHLLSLTSVIIAGRDIGTVVIPDAELKLYLDVSLQERAARRLWSQGERDLTQAIIEKDLELRDDMDSHRETSPLRIAHDAVVVRTDKLTVDETVDMIIKMCGLSPFEQVTGAPGPLRGPRRRDVGRHAVDGGDALVKFRDVRYVVGGYVVRSDTALLLWHPDMARWVPAGGRIEVGDGEYPHEAVVREVREECGLHVQVIGVPQPTTADDVAEALPVPAGIQEIRVGPVSKYLDFVYFCQVLDGDLTLDYREARAYHWFTESDLYRYPLLPHVRNFASRALHAARQP